MRQDVIVRQGGMPGAAAKHSPIRQLSQLGQSPWLDGTGRRGMAGAELERMISEWGVRGVTTSSLMFENAIARTHDYDRDVAALAAEGLGATEIYETIATREVVHAADLLLPVFESADGGDGFVTLDVAPGRAADAGETIAEAKHLWAMLSRPNAMIAVPGTDEGLTAMRALLAEGINVCVTLVFSARRYQDVLTAYLEGLEAAAAAGRDLSRIASVAAFPLYALDTAVDEQLEALAADGDARGRIAGAFRGQAAIATARRARTASEELAAAPRFRRLADRGAHPQRPMWAGIGTDRGADADIRYVQSLIAAHTVCALPLDTLRAFHAHGRPARALNGRDDADAAATLQQLADIGISLDAVAAGLLRSSMDTLVRVHDGLIEILEIARQSALKTATGRKKPRKGDGRSDGR